MRIALDTETNGLYINLGCRAFMINGFDDDGNKFVWELDVDPYTREVDYNTPKAKRVIRNFVNTIKKYSEWVFHNSVFDLWVLSCIPYPKSFNFDKYINPLNKNVIIHDTMLMAHAVNSLLQRGLKAPALIVTGKHE